MCSDEPLTNKSEICNWLFCAFLVRMLVRVIYYALYHLLLDCWLLKRMCIATVFSCCCSCRFSIMVYMNVASLISARFACFFVCRLLWYHWQKRLSASRSSIWPSKGVVWQSFYFQWEAKFDICNWKCFATLLRLLLLYYYYFLNVWAAFFF